MSGNKIKDQSEYECDAILNCELDLKMSNFFVRKLLHFIV